MKVPALLMLLLGSLNASRMYASPEPQGAWELRFHLAESVQCSFPCHFDEQGNLLVLNGSEYLAWTLQDNGCYHFALFDGWLEGSWKSDTYPSHFTGHWVDSLRIPVARIPITLAPAGKPHRPTESLPTAHWDFYFGEGPLVGSLVFNSEDPDDATQLHASIWTTTGDFRYLTGFIRNKSLILSTFDGSHLYHFLGTLDANGTLQGLFYNGSQPGRPWRAEPVEDMPGAVIGRLTTLPGVPIAFSGMDHQGANWSFPPPEEQADLTILDITATWCPNCLDATRLIQELTAGTEASIACVYLAFERGALSQPDKSLERIARYAQQLHPEGTWLLGGEASKEAARLALPFLPSVPSFPTVVFIPREGTPEVYTGFYGPATGSAYLQQRAAFESAITRLSHRP